MEDPTGTISVAILKAVANTPVAIPTVDTPVDKVTEKAVAGMSMDSLEAVTEEEMDTAAEVKVEIVCPTLVPV